MEFETIEKEMRTYRENPFYKSYQKPIATRSNHA